MLISCEKCSTTYVLDDALIPAQGAPVQCTRCNHVFTARLPSKDLASTLPGPPNWDAGKKPGSATVVFGQAAVPGPAAPPQASQTMAFGAVSAPSGAPPAGKQTMVFGAPGAAAPPSAPPGKQTMVFGAAAPPSAPPGKQTMVFGAAAPPSAPPGKQTMVFGAPSAPPPPAGPAGKQTMVFGAVPPGAQAPAASAPAQPAKNQTMMFGRVPGGAAPKVTSAAPGGEEPKERSESTVRVDLEAMMRGQGAEDFDAVQARHDRTQRYAMAQPPPTAPTGSPESGEARHDRTQLFAMTSQQETTKPDANAPPQPELGKRMGDTTLPPGFAEMPTLEPDAHPPPAAASGPLHQTLVFGAQGGRAQVSTDPGLDPPGVRVLLEPGMVTPPEAAASSPEPIATTLPNLAPIERGQGLPPLRVDLPPEPSFPTSSSLPPQASAPEDEAMAELRASSSRRTAIAVVIFLVIALGLGLAVLWHLFGRSLLGGDGNAEALAKTEQAVARLRMDDRDSRTGAIRDLEAVLAAAPDLVEARAGLVMALAFAYDDEGVWVTTYAEQARHGRVKASAAEEAQARRKAAEQQLKPELEKLQIKLRELPAGTPESQAALRALAVAFGALGDARALELAEQHHQRTSTPDDWADLAVPEYQATRGADPSEALKLLDEVGRRKSNSTFFRVLVLKARLHDKLGEKAPAEEALHTVTTLNSKHELAAAMLDALRPTPPPGESGGPGKPGKLGKPVEPEEGGGKRSAARESGLYGK
ncbi:MAG: hypothetical protein AMXMBFR34_09220 [Myxococcaceae bacterium]